MAKKKKKKFREFESSAVREDYQEPYTCITKSMMMSDNWKSLSSSSKIIYTYMKLWSYGRQEFTFSYTLGLEIVSSRTTFKKSIDELVNKGFIEITLISKRPGIGTHYKFIDKWYK